MPVKIIPKEITASKSSGAAKEEESTGVGDEKGRSGEIREGSQKGERGRRRGKAYADKHV